MLYENGEFERIRPHLTPLECGIIFDGIPEGAISRKVGLIWGIPVETSMLKTITTYDHVSWIQGQMFAKDPETYPFDPSAGIGRPNPTGYLPARTKDGRWIQLGNIVERLFHSMMRSLELNFIYEDPRFKTAPFLEEEHVASLERIMLERIQEKTLAEWMDMFVGEAADVAAEPYRTSEEALDHPQILHNGHVRRMNHPRWGEMRQLGPMVMMTETPGSPRAPLLNLASTQTRSWRASKRLTNSPPRASTTLCLNWLWRVLPCWTWER